jgi:hypothetical protein
VRDFELLFDNGTLGAFTASVGAEKQNVHVCISPLMKLSVVRRSSDKHSYPGASLRGHL